MTIADEFVACLGQRGYHPRSSAHSDFLSELIIRDLVATCTPLRERAAKGEVVAQLRHHQTVGHDDWVIDIAIGSCSGVPEPPEGAAIRRAAPAIIQIAIELKSIMTEHGKARRNRLRDFQAFHNFAHSYHPKTVAAAFLVVNASQYFYSPLRRPDDITSHATGSSSARIVAADAVSLFRSLPLRHVDSERSALEAVGVIVVEHDLVLHPEREKHTAIARPSRVAPNPPGVPIGDPLHYSTMLQRICGAYASRF